MDLIRLKTKDLLNLLLEFYFLQHEELFLKKIFNTDQTEVDPDMKVFTRH